MTYPGKILLRNLEYSREIIEQGYNVIIFYPFSLGRDFPDHIYNLCILNEIFDDWSPRLKKGFDYGPYSGLDGIVFNDGKFLAFIGVYEWELNGIGRPLPLPTKIPLVNIRYDFDPDLALTEDIIDS